MTNENGYTNKAEQDLVGALSSDELDLINGGDPKGYHECVIGSVGGGGPGLYPLYVLCRMN